MIPIDGSQGEGGGQILRTALALSLCTGEPFRITQIRAGRNKPGLLRQHLTAVRAAEQVGQAAVSGAEIGARELTFAPGQVRAGAYRFAVGTAGSATLVFQTILPALMTAPAASTLVCQGGTLNPFAPPYDFLQRSFAPLVARLGADLELDHHRAGFYPAGGGEFSARIRPAAPLRPLSLLHKGELRQRRALVYTANLPFHIAERELAHLKRQLSWPEECFELVRFPGSPGPGNVVLLEEGHEHVTEIATGFGAKGVSSEQVAQTAVAALRRYQASGAAVGEHLADQLLLPLALAGGGEFITLRPTHHALTNARTIAAFLDVNIRFLEETASSWRCVVERK